MRYLTLGDVLSLHGDLVATSGGATGVRDLFRVQAALAQPIATFAAAGLYPTVVDKAGALGFALVQGHAFVDGNKRIGHAAMEVFLMLNGFELKRRSARFPCPHCGGLFVQAGGLGSSGAITAAH